MNKETLIKKLGELLGISNSEKSFCFELFINKIVEILMPNDALKFRGIGVFLLQEEPFTKDRDLPEESYPTSVKSTLIYSPKVDTNSENSHSMFLKFNVTKEKQDSFEFDESVFKLGFEEPIIPLKDGKSIPDSNRVNKSAEKIIEDKIDDLISEAEYIKDFDLWDSYLNDRDEKPADKISAIEKDIEINIEPENINNETDEIKLTGEDISEDQIEKKENEIEEVKQDYTAKLNEIKQKEKKYSVRRTSKAPIFIIGSFLIIAVAVLYYMFFVIAPRDPVAVANTNQQLGEKTVLPEDSTKLKNKIPEKSEPEKPILRDEKVLSWKYDPQTETPIIQNFENETKFGELVFYNGTNYCVQISSWKSKVVAESEAKRLRRMGYNAFVTEAYIEQFKNTWFRLRIGFFDDAEKADVFLNNHKF